MLEVTCVIDADSNVTEADEGNNEFAKSLSLVSSRDLLLVLTNDPFEDSRVRGAIQRAVDWEQLAREIFPGQDVTLGLELFEGGLREVGDVQDLTYDPEKAKELLAEAGFLDGFGVSLLVGPDDGSLGAMAEWMKSYLVEVGIEAYLTGEPGSREKMAMSSAAGQPAIWLTWR